MSWVGDAPKKCELCNAPLTRAFVDGTTYSGLTRGMPGPRWVCMCLKCHGRHGIGLGPSVGAQWEKQAVPQLDGGVKLEWVKVRG